MARRTTRNITNIRGTGAVNASEVWRVLECYRPGCNNLLKVSEDWMEQEKEQSRAPRAICGVCGFENHTELLLRASRWKYCRVCEWLQPLENFHKHKPSGKSFRSGRQLECKVCKNTRINVALNPKRTSDQHRESAERRRLYVLLSGESRKIDSKVVFKRFGGKCFNCDRPLKDAPRGAQHFHLDHTLPARYLWPLTTTNATLLCDTCNNKKHDQWPAQFYVESKLRALSRLTGIEYELLAGPPQLNPAAVEIIKTNVDEFIERWIRYPDEIKRIRRLILELEQVDIFENARTVPEFLE